MTIDFSRWDAFDQLVAEYDCNAWYAAWMEARQALNHLQGRKGYNVAAIGWLAWNELTPAQRRDALDGFFTTYYLEIHEEEHDRQLQDDVETGKSYLEGWETGSLHDAVMEADVTDEDAEVTVSAQALHRVLSELDILQHRLAMKGQ